MAVTAVYPVSSGVPSHSGTYTPEIFAGKTVVKFYKATFLSDISNTDYQGDIKNQGDTVHIRTVPNITIQDYTIGQGLTRENPVPGDVELYINKGKYWSFVVNDVQELQSDIPYQNKFTDDAAMQMKVAVEEDVLGNIYSSASADNKGTTAGLISNNIDLGTTAAWETVTNVNILDYIVDMQVVLSEQNVPDDGQRWLLMPASFCGLLKTSDLKNVSITGDGKSTLRTGKVGEIDGFMIYETNCLTRSLDTGSYIYNCIFGHKSGLTFASQLIKNRIIDNPTDFGKIVEGLQVYGYKVTDGKSIGHFYATK